MNRTKCLLALGLLLLNGCAYSETKETAVEKTAPAKTPDAEKPGAPALPAAAPAELKADASRAAGEANAHAPETSPAVEKAHYPFNPQAAIVNFDLQTFINGQLASGAKTITVPPGRYRVNPGVKQRAVHLVLENLTDVTIIAKGVQMICTETTQAVAIKNCKNLKVIGLTIDYDPLTFTQAKITAMAEDKRWIEFKIQKGYPENLEERIEILDGKTERLKRSMYYEWLPFEKKGPGHYRVSKGENYRYNEKFDREEVGDFLVTNNADAPGGSAAHTVVIERCTDLVLQDITSYGSNCFSFLEYYCDNTTYLRCKVERCPPEFDLQPREHRRLRSGNADAFHSKHALRGPKLIECVAEYMGDDAVNICGEYYFVLDAKDDKIRIGSRGEINIKPGHELELFTYTGQRLPNAIATSVQSSVPVKEEEAAFIKEQRMNANNKVFLSSGKAKTWVVTLDRNVDLPRGSAIASTEHMGNGFLVQNCKFGPNRSRGILIKASHGSVTGNTLTGNVEAAILLAPEWWWLESGSASHVLINNNIISECGQPAIRIIAQAGKNGAPGPAGAHSNISIRGNQILSAKLPYIEVTSTNLLNIDNNKFPKESGVDDLTGAIKLTNCKNISGSDVPAVDKL
ncbi:MAG: right-handed parallel beta-helix repeat-containing protein [Verrucomicrobia bacterium]|nr:right-handed parallel beta-helix repeat-containing protein [Verrucomicrobiota bacterium]